jgi:hypothetical protein
MPVSKHRKKGLTPRQWRKRRNLRRASETNPQRAEIRGRIRAAQVMAEELEKEELKKVESEN